MNNPDILSIGTLADGILAATSGPVFGIPGGGASLELLDALEQKGGDFVRTHFEGCASLMAGTVGRMSGRPGACLSIKGPGLANMVPGLAASALESFPLLAICEAFPRDTAWRERHKGMDHSELAAAVSKGAFGLAGERVVESAVALAAAEVPGPVVLNLNDSKATPPPSEAEDEAIDTVMRHVEMARQPVVIAGSLAVRSAWSKHLKNLTVPVFVTASAKGVLDETLPYAAGVYTGVGLERTPESTILPKADLVIGLGLRAKEVLAAKAFSCPSVNIDPVQSDRSFEFAATARTKSVEPVLNALTSSDWGADLIANSLTQLDSVLFSTEFLPAHVFATIAHHFTGCVRGVFDTGNFCTIAEHIWRPRRSDLCLLSGQGRYMGTGLPMAIAAAEYDTSIPTIAFLGDGGIGMYLAEAKIAAERSLPLLICLLSDGGYGSVRSRAIRDGLTQTPLIIDQPSWLAAIEGMGIPGIFASSEESLVSALQSWDPTSGPRYLEISFDSNAYQGMVNGVR